MTVDCLKIGTRGSPLALAQSRWVKERLEARHRGLEVQLVKISTKGDRILDSPLSRIGGKGLFVKEIEDALLDGRVDVAVHSVKDVPAELPADLVLTSFPFREDPRDALITGTRGGLRDLPEGARIGTSSLRRSAQLLNLRPDFRILSLRGNVDTRLRKLREGHFDAVILASAGLVRLGLEKHVSTLLPAGEMLSAIGQGALGLEVRRSDRETIECLSFLNHPPTETAVKAERAFLKRLEGGCQVPIAGLAWMEGESVVMDGLVAELDGGRVIRDRISGDPEKAESLGKELAERLLNAGGGEILKQIYAVGGAD